MKTIMTKKRRCQWLIGGLIIMIICLIGYACHRGMFWFYPALFSAVIFAVVFIDWQSSNMEEFLTNFQNSTPSIQKLVNGLMYDTDKAQKLMSAYIEVEYKNKKGSAKQAQSLYVMTTKTQGTVAAAFFLLKAFPGIKGTALEPLTEEEARKWLETQSLKDREALEVYEKYFDITYATNEE